MCQQPVNAGYSHVVQPHHLAAQYFRSKGGFLRHRNVAGAAGGDDHLADAVRLREAAHDADLCLLSVVHRRGLGHKVRRLPGHPGDQNPVLPVTAHGFHNPRNLLGRLACTVNYFCRALPEFPVQVHLGIADVLKGGHFDFQKGIVYAGLSGLNVLQQFAKIRVHVLTSKSSNTPEYLCFKRSRMASRFCRTVCKSAAGT